MVRLIFIFLLGLSPLAAGAQKLYCREYDLSASDYTEKLLTSDTTCYQSVIRRKEYRGVLKIETNQSLFVFAVLNTIRVNQTISTYGVIPGYPDQLYLIREMNFKESTDKIYTFSIHPIRLNPIHKREISGRVFEAANKPLISCH